MENILAKIVGRVKEEQGPLFDTFDPAAFPLEKRAPPMDIVALCERSFLFIAEVKKGSPSRGIIRRDFDPAGLARSCEEGGASAVSVITEKNYFFGGKDHLRLVRQAVRLPVLRKDFIVHEYQVYESYNLGADFILLIAACLNDGELTHLHRVAESLGMRALVEVHGEEDLDKAFKAKPKLIGINNRDLRTFAVDWALSLRLRPLVPAGIHVISESGIRSFDQVRILREKGFSGVLVGEYLMRRDDPRSALKGLILDRPSGGPDGGKTGERVRVKICGLTNKADLDLAADLGADYAGFVFVRPSPRFVRPSAAAALIRQAKNRPGRRPLFVGVFVNESPSTVRSLFTECGLDIVQLQGDETPEYCRELGLPFWKAFRLKDEASLLDLDRFPRSTFLLDSYAEGFYGGSGRPFSRVLAAKALQRGFPVILAGGISAENLSEVLRLRPLGVDVCSSLEERPGIKSERKMKAFFQKLHGLRNQT